VHHPALRDFARLAQAAHAVALLRLLAGALLYFLANARLIAVDLAVVVQVLSYAAFGGVALGAVAAQRADVAGLVREARLVLGGVVVWVVLVIVAQRQDEQQTFVAPIALIADLTQLAWCSLLGRAVATVGATNVLALRQLALALLVVHAGIQLMPLPTLAAFGPSALGLATLLATTVPFTSASIDAHHLLRALKAQPPDEVLPHEPISVEGPDDPWRPGA
jgi:hypothetical protein